MEVTIIGTGNMARGIGSRLLAGGHDLTVVGKDSERLAGKVVALARDGGLNPIDTGPLKRARELKAASLLHIGLQNTLERALEAPSTSSRD